MKPLYKEYENTKPVGVLTLSNWGGLEILALNYEECIACFNWGTGRQMIRRHNIMYTASGRPYIRKAGRRYYLDEIIKN